jgi:dipeptidyl aminopeptidase/acylaminoacyl peptidase
LRQLKGSKRLILAARARRYPAAARRLSVLGRCAAMALAAWVVLPSAALGSHGPTRAMTVDDQFRLVGAGDPLISPDGKWVVYSVSRTSLSENARHSILWLASTQGTVIAREFLREGDDSPMWAPDSRSVYFLRSIGSGSNASRELFEQSVDQSTATQRSHIGPGPDGSWQMSPDGSFFLVTRDERSPSAPGADFDVVFVYEGSNGQSRASWSNLWRYDLNSEKLTRVTRRNWTVNDCDISPDGRHAVVAARPDNQRETRWKSELFVVNLSNGSTRQITHNVVPEIDPQWSPDGSQVLFSAVSLHRWENGNGDLWLMNVASGLSRDVTPNHTGRFGHAVFSPDGRMLFAPSGFGTARFPVRIDIATGRIESLLTTDGSARVGSWSADRRTFAYVYQDAATPPDVYVGRANVMAYRQRRLTDLNPWVRQTIALGSVQRVHWSSFDGKRIEGLLYMPPRSATSGKPRPLIVHVPCGPGCAWLNTFSVKNQVWAGLGYAQLSVNVRGASNYDDAFMRANSFDVGGGDRRDIMSGVDAMIARKVADPDRLGIDGWSYGAVLAGYTITKTDRFKAAVLGATVSDWTSEYGAGTAYDMERWYIGGDPWTQAQRWRDRSSLTYANHASTPTLLHHGDDDSTDSPFQSMMFFKALRKFGVEARLIRYPDEPHDLQQPQHIRIRDNQDVLWMQRFVGSAEAGRPATP